MPSNDVLLNKKVSLERCLAQVRAYWKLPSTLPFEQDQLRQDAIAMNLQRACELCIDMANYVVKARKLGLPQDSAESFSLLEHAGLLDAALSRKLRGMVGFRNVLVHEYARLDLGIMVSVIENDSGDLLNFAAIALRAARQVG